MDNAVGGSGQDQATVREFGRIPEDRARLSGACKAAGEASFLDCDPTNGYRIRIQTPDPSAWQPTSVGLDEGGDSTTKLVSRNITFLTLGTPCAGFLDSGKSSLESWTPEDAILGPQGPLLWVPVLACQGTKTANSTVTSMGLSWRSTVSTSLG